METTLSFDYGREALAFVESLDRLTSPEQVMDGMQAVLGEFGIEFFCFSDLALPDQKFEDVLWASRIPADWLRLYLEQDYVHDDPTIRMCKHTVHPFAYRDAPYDPESEPRAAEIVQRAGEFGLDKGILVPVPGPSGCTGFAWAGGYQPDLSARTRPLLHFMALYAFDRIHALVAPGAQAKPRLTPREREVLSWIASGKSAWAVGEILKISKRTVDEHAQSACRKLRAANRTQAVAIALRDRLIRL